MTTGIESFFANRGYGTYRLTPREKRYIMRTFEPKSNNAPSLGWVGHFIHKQMAYTLHGNLLTRAGWVSTINTIPVPAALDKWCSVCGLYRPDPEHMAKMHGRGWSHEILR